MIRIAIQAKGRLNEKSSQLLADAGIELNNISRKLLINGENFPAEILYLRDDDIPGIVASGVADVGIVGRNEVIEKEANVIIRRDLGFGKCSLALALPKEFNYSGLEDLNGKTIATSYPRTLQTFFKENNISAQIAEISGSVEVSPAAGIADGIFDLVSSGGTLVCNGLKKVETVLESSAVLITTPGLNREKQEILDQLLFRFDSILRSKGQKYVLMNIPNEQINNVLEVLPSLKSPTLLPLAQNGWSSLHTVIQEKRLWEAIEQVKKLGAEDILVLTLDKIIA